MQVVTERQPTEARVGRPALRLAGLPSTSSRTRSSSPRTCATVGIGAGQMSRVDSVRLAVEKARLDRCRARRSPPTPSSRSPTAPSWPSGGRRARSSSPADRATIRRRRGRGRRRDRDGLHGPAALPPLAHRLSVASASVRRARILPGSVSVTVSPQTRPSGGLEALAGAGPPQARCMGRRAVPALGGARRGQDPPGARPRPRAAAQPRRPARRRRLPDDAADPPVGGGRRAPRAAPRARRAPSCARRRTSTASRSPTRARRRRRPAGRRSARRARSSSPTRPTTSATTSRGATGFRTAFGATRRWLLLSGTPFRSDAMPIPGVTYDDGLAGPTSPTRTPMPSRTASAARSRSSPTTARCPGMSGDDLVEASFSDALTGRDASRRYRTAISTDLADGLPKILASAHERLLALREGDHRDAGGLVVAADSAHARADREGAAGDVTASRPTVVLHAEARAPPEAAGVPHWPRSVDRRREHGLRGRRHPAPARRRLRDRGEDAAHLPPDRRALRPHDPGPPAGEHSWVYLPGDPVLRVHAGEVETELRHVLRAVEEPADGLLDEPAERQRSEPTEELAVRPGRGRREPADGALRRRPAAAGRAPVAVPRAAGAARRSPRTRCRPGSAAPGCGTSATASSHRCGASTAARSARSTRG